MNNDHEVNSHPDDIGYYGFEVSPTRRYIILDPASNPMDAASVVAVLNRFVPEECGCPPAHHSCVFHDRFPKESE